MIAPVALSVVHMLSSKLHSEIYDQMTTSSPCKHHKHQKTVFMVTGNRSFNILDCYSTLTPFQQT